MFRLNKKLLEWWQVTVLAFCVLLLPLVTLPVLAIGFLVKMWLQRKPPPTMPKVKGKYCRKPVSAREIEIIKGMKHKLKLPITHIATATDRTKKTIYDALKRKAAVKKGRPVVLTAQEVRRLIGLLRAMIKRAKARREVTMAMLIKKSKTKVCARTWLGRLGRVCAKTVCKQCAVAARSF